MSLPSVSTDPAAVREIQLALDQAARTDPALPRLTVDGIYGADTRQAVTLFQQSADLPVTGVVDTATWSALSEAASRSQHHLSPTATPRFFPADRPLCPAEEPRVFTVAQLILNALHTRYAAPPLPITGMNDPATRQALCTFQQQSGLEPTGQLDRTTWDRLAETYERVIFTRPCP